MVRRAAERFYPEDVKIISLETVRAFLGRPVTTEDLDLMAENKTFTSREHHLYYETHGTLDPEKVRENGKAAEEGSIPVGNVQGIPGEQAD